MKHKLTKIGNPPYFGQFGAPPSLFCARPLYPQGVLKVPVGDNNHLLAPVMGDKAVSTGIITKVSASSVHWGLCEESTIDLG